MNVVLDPYILMIPDGMPERIIDYLDTLEVWTVAINDEDAHRFWLSQAIVNALWDAGLYPTWEAFTRLDEQLPKDRTKPFDALTAFLAIEHHITQPPYLDDLVHNADYYYEEDQVVVIPKAIAERLPDEVADALRETMALSVIGYVIDSDPVFQDLAFATVPNGFTEKTLKTTVEAEHIEQNHRETLTKEWQLVRSPKDLDSLMVFWEDTDKAVQWAKRQVERKRLDTTQMADYIVGKRFNKSIRRWHMDRKKDLLETLFIKIVECLSGHIPRSDTSRGTPNHPIREERKSHKQVTRRRDGATAWRLRIQGDWRLHYWLLEDGSIELANVEKGHSMHIES